MKAETLIAIVAALAAVACSHNPRRDTRPARMAYDCYDAWPYVYYAPYDCWRNVWYGPAYYYYDPYRTYYAPATRTAERPDLSSPTRRVRERVPLPGRDREEGLPPPPSLPRPDLPDRLP